jgi:predicted ABC-type ATPase
MYIIAGPNGAGKTTASFAILPEMFMCEEFVNADEIAAGLSPFHPEKVSIQAGRLMLERIHALLNAGATFAFETTLATKSYVHIIHLAHQLGFHVTLIFLALDTKELAIERVRTRVAEGGHHIPTDVIIRRFDHGLQNFFHRYMPLVDQWIFVDNSSDPFRLVAHGDRSNTVICENAMWNQFQSQCHAL